MSQNKGILPVTGVALGAVAGPFIGWGLALIIIGIVLLLCARTFRRRSLEAPVYEGGEVTPREFEGRTFFVDVDETGYYTAEEVHFMHEER